MNDFQKAQAEPFKPHQCMHWSNGRRCRAYAIHNEYFCVRHRIDPIVNIVPSEPFSLPPFLTDRAQIQAALGEVLNRLAAKTIDDKRAGLLLYSLQTAVTNLLATPSAACPTPSTPPSSAAAVAAPSLAGNPSTRVDRATTDGCPTSRF